MVRGGGGGGGGWVGGRVQGWGAVVSVAVTTGLRTFLSKNERWLFFKMISVNIAIISGLGETWG